MPDPLKSFDDQITVRIATEMRERIEAFVSPATPKPADIARLLLEFGLRAAEAHGLHTVLGVVERNAPIVLTQPTIDALYPPLTSTPTPVETIATHVDTEKNAAEMSGALQSKLMTDAAARKRGAAHRS
jgi:hypothetical protein